MLRARLNGGIRNKAARGELRRGLLVGFVWGDADGEVPLHPDEAVVTAIRTVFQRFAETGSARRVWLWFSDPYLHEVRPHRFDTNAHHHGSLPQQLGVVWSPLLEADSEGPAFISHTAVTQSVSSFANLLLLCACGALSMPQ